MIEQAARGHGHFRSLAWPGEEGCLVESNHARDGSRWSLGVFAPDRVRSIVVITTDGELAVAVRDAVPPRIAVVRDARPDDASRIAAACLPWPWMVIATTGSMPPGLAAVLRSRPVLTLWLGARPAGLPGHASCFDRPGALLEAVRGACAAQVGGMRLAPGSGVELRDGTLLRGATLDALIGAYPDGFALPSRTFRTVATALDRRGAGWTPERSLDGHVVLVRCAPDEAHA